ncbi:MAG: GrpB family protein [Candidatus Celaenobacter antarcticus]|nr:GrpB family protein [Candidatus Celaenobacter antarcticus]
MNKIIVESYNPKWKKEFEKACKFYQKLLKNINVKIEHVGSTSVEGMWAKPILDIDIIVINNSDSKQVIERLISIGYNHVGNLGVEGREALKYTKGNKYINWMDHNLYVCIDGCENLRNHLLLRKHLRNNEKAIKSYSKIKRELAEKYSNDIDSYIDEKTNIITEFLKNEGMDIDELNRIETINKKSK